MLTSWTNLDYTKFCWFCCWSWNWPQQHRLQTPQLLERQGTIRIVIRNQSQRISFRLRNQCLNLVAAKVSASNFHIYFIFDCLVKFENMKKIKTRHSDFLASLLLYLYSNIASRIDCPPMRSKYLPFGHIFNKFLINR